MKLSQNGRRFSEISPICYRRHCTAEKNGNKLSGELASQVIEAQMLRRFFVQLADECGSPPTLILPRIKHRKKSKCLDKPAG